MGRKSRAADSTASASASADTGVLETATNKSDVVQMHNDSSNIAGLDGTEDIGGAAGFAAPTYSTVDKLEEKVKSLGWMEVGP